MGNELLGRDLCSPSDFLHLFPLWNGAGVLLKLVIFLVLSTITLFLALCVYPVLNETVQLGENGALVANLSRK